MIDILLHQMQEELASYRAILGDEDLTSLIENIVAEYDLNWIDAKYCISRLHHKDTHFNTRRD